MTSSLRNSVHRPTHKERSQLAHRRKYGILEKHSDYVKRARDYHSKQDRLARLRQKAAERNKDEFYFAMVNEKTKGGVHAKDRGNAALPTDIVKVLKTQDENYVRTMRMANLKKIDSLKRQLTEMIDLIKTDISRDSDDDESLDSRQVQLLREAGILPSLRKGKSPKHIVFVDNDEEAQKLASRTDHAPSDVEQAETLQQNVDLGWKTSTKEKRRKKTKKALISKSDEMDEDEDDEQDQGEKSHRGRTRLLKELSARLVRDTQLRYAQREFEMQRLMMGKGARKKISAAEKVEGDEDEDEDEDEIDARKGKRTQRMRKVDETLYKPRVYKWKLERKR